MSHVLAWDGSIYRVLVYVLLLSDEYPPFRLDTGGQEPSAPTECQRHRHPFSLRDQIRSEDAMGTQRHQT